MAQAGLGIAILLPHHPKFSVTPGHRVFVLFYFLTEGKKKKQMSLLSLVCPPEAFKWKTTFGFCSLTFWTFLHHLKENPNGAFDAELLLPPDLCSELHYFNESSLCCFRSLVFSFPGWNLLDTFKCPGILQNRMTSRCKPPLAGGVEVGQMTLK